MDATDWLHELGGTASRGTLERLVGRAALDRAVSDGTVVRIARGRYALPTVDEAKRAAAALGGAVSSLSAALHHGWAVKWVPERPHVTVSRGRKVRAATGVHLHRAELRPEDVADGVTRPAVTLRDCLRQLTFDEGLAVADSALRRGFPRAELLRITETARGPGAVRMHRVGLHADGRAANPFESVLRATCLDVPGLRVVPQVTLPALGVRPDLVDERLRLVLEADSFEWHGGRTSLARDARRYNSLVVEGWTVLRFSWEDVMWHADDVRDTVLRAVAMTELMNERRERGRPAA